MTGHLFGQLASGQRFLDIDDDVLSQRWVWSVNYTKFRGRGGGATEKYVGADGIVELIVSDGSIEHRKAALFQAKMGGRGGRDLLRQSLKLTTWREASFVVNYDQQGYGAAHLDDVIRAGGRSSPVEQMSFADFLGREFLDCRVGDPDLRYDAPRRRLEWRDETERRISVPFAVGNRLRVRAQTLPPVPSSAHPTDVHPSDLASHRMLARPEEVLMVEIGAGPEEISEAAQRQLSTFAICQGLDLGDEYQRLIDQQLRDVHTAEATLLARLQSPDVDESPTQADAGRLSQWATSP